MEILLDDYKRKMKSLQEMIHTKNLSDDIMKARISTKASMCMAFIIDIERAIAREKERNSITH